MNNELIKSLLNSDAAYKISGKLWIECNGKKFFGPGPVELLTYIEQTGSINKAAKEMNMSYKQAWEIINVLNELAAHPLVITQSGGEKGGGSVITEEAKRLIDYHKQLRERFDAFLEKETLDLSS